MKKLSMIRHIGLWAMLIGVIFLISCNPDDNGGGKAVASFQFEVSAENFLTVDFTNFSKNANGYSWDFGDGNMSEEVEPSHTYDAAGTYTVTLTAFGDNGEATKSESIVITDPNEALTKLAGTTSKTWKLYREGAAMSLGESAAIPNNYWPGFTNNGSRPCLYEQEFTFHRDGTYEFDDNGVFWAEYGVFNGPTGCDTNTIAESCFDVSGGTLVNECGTDVSAWLSGTHSFAYNASTGALTLTGTGAWIGIPKLGTTAEVLVPQSEVQTKISITENDGFDVMKVEFSYAAAYWVAYYANYTTATEPAIVSLNAAFSATSNGLTATFVNQSSGESSWSWNFGDGGTSTEENPQHTYASAGTYSVTLTISDGSGTAMVTKDVTVSSVSLTDAPATPTADAGSVISIYSDAYTNVAGVNTNPNWGQATVVTNEVIASNNVLKLTGLNYQGIDFGGNQDVAAAGMTHIHIDLWSATEVTMNLSLISPGPLETPRSITITAGEWNSLDIPLSEWSAVVNMTQVFQMKFDATTSPTFYVDNIYFVNIP